MSSLTQIRQFGNTQTNSTPTPAQIVQNGPLQVANFNSPSQVIQFGSGQINSTRAQIVLPQSLIKSIGNSNTTWLPLANISITDTNVHSYITDPSNIAIIKLGNLLATGNRQLSSFSLWLYNGEDQPVTVQPITNIVKDGSYPDIPIIGTQLSVLDGSASLSVFPFVNYSLEYFSIQLSFSTAPTSGSVLAILYMYYGD